MQLIQSVSATFTRPSNTDTYAAGDALSNATSSPSYLTFTNCALRGGQRIVLIDAQLTESVVAATPLVCELWLFHTAPTATEDNATFDPSDTEVGNLACPPLTFSAAKKGSINTVYRADETMVTVRTVGHDLYGMVVVRNAYAPASAETLEFDLNFLVR